MKRLRRSYPISLALALMMIGSMLFGNWSASAALPSGQTLAGTVSTKAPAPQQPAVNTTTVVTPSNLNGWFFYNDENDTIDNSLGTFVSGPGAPPAGSGSAQISVTGTQRRNLATYQFSGTPLANITTLKFSTYNPSAGNGGSPNRSGYLNFNVDFNGSDTWQRRLVFIPSQNGTVTQNTWKEWDAIGGGAALWQYSGPTWPASSQPGTTPKTWSQILTDYPGVRIRATDAFVGIRVGEPYPDGYTENIDKFVFGTAAGTATFDFDPTTANSTVVVTAANMHGWAFVNEGGIGSGAFVSGPATPPLGSGSAALTIGADGREDLDTQLFANTRLDQITNLNYSTYGPNNTQAATLQLDVNYDGVNHWEGRLVYEPYQNGTVVPNTWQYWNAATGVWWASGAPGNTNCGQATPCTLTQILGFWPNATISSAAAGGELLLRAGGPWPAGTYNADALTVGVGGNNTTFDFANSQILTVDDDASPCATAAYTTIQTAVDAASDGDIVQVCGGTYTEQVNISKAITLNGSGQGSAIIQAPATPLAAICPAGGTNKPVVCVHDTNAVVQNLTVDGMGRGNANYRFDGVAFYNAGGTIDHITLIGIRDNPLSGTQHGVAIYANNQDGTPRTLTVDHNTISDYQKNGMALNNPGLTANVTNNTVTGSGPLGSGLPAQNGIQIGFGATGTVSNNTVTANSYTPGTDTAAGILFYQSNADTSGNTLTENQVGVSRVDSSGTDSGNTIHATASGTGTNLFWGMIVDAPPADRQPSPYGEGTQQLPQQAQQVNSIETNTITNNSLTSDGTGSGIGIEVDGGLGTADINFVANHNTINHWDTGLDVYQCTTGCTTGNFNNVVAVANTITNNRIGILVDGGQITGPVHLNNNHIQGNTLYGIRNTTSPATLVDGTYNWWGSVNGPTLGGTNPLVAGDTVGTNINYSPYVIGQDFAHFTPVSPITVLAGSPVTLDLLINATAQAALGQQSYLSFPPAMLQATVTGDLTTFQQSLQNAVDNTNGLIAYASGRNFGGGAVGGDFRVAQVTFQTSASQTGDAVVHWQFSPPDPANRNSKIVDASSNTVSDGSLYQDFVIHIVHPQFIGNVIWQGRTVGTPAYALPINLTLTNTSSNVVYTFSTTTDTNGNFSVDVNALPTGSYNWHVKGSQYLSTSGGPVALNGVAVPPTVNMGTQLAGDANNDNLVDVTDFGILYGSFGNYTDPRADFNGDTVVDITDFGYLAGNFGQLGNRPGKVVEKQADGSAVLELRPQGKGPANGGTVHVGDSFTLELWVNARPGTTVVGQQSYLTFPSSQLQLGNDKNLGPRTGSNGVVTADGNVLDVTLQNAICNASTSCVFNGQTVPAGSLAFASGTLGSVAGSGAFRVGQVTVQATAPGTTTLHWQFSPQDPITRNTKIVSENGVTVSQPGQFVDYVLNVLPAGK